MDNNKRRKIYDKDSTVVEISNAEKKNNLRIELNDKISTADSEKKTILVTDILDTFAGYIPPRISFIDSGEGECILCGKTTASKMRKVCFDCMKDNSKKLYEKAKNAIEHKETEFEF